jgi:DNA invertase Pin-like site-specific DNA recombinase
MITVEEIIARRKRVKIEPTDEELRHLPDRRGFIYGRVSKPGQIVKSAESIREIANLVDVAKQDGFRTELTSEPVWSWLERIRAGLEAPGVIENGEVIVDCRDLGISGTLKESKRPGLAYLRKRLEAGEIGAIYVTEGASRLSRDEKKVMPYTLLELMEDSNCKLRTPDQILSPCIERDWETIEQDFIEAGEEQKTRRKRLHRRRMNKAKRGEHIGTPVPPGFYLPIVGHRTDGSYIFGRYELYEPHMRVNIIVLKEFVHWRGSIATAHALRENRVVYPFFPEELSYMNSRTSLRRSPRIEEEGGWAVTPSVVDGLIDNPKQIGAWVCGDTVIRDNHSAVFSGEVLDLWLQAAEIKAGRKPRGKGATVEPLPFAGLLFCANHEDLCPISTHNTTGRLRCDKDYHIGAPICLDVVAHIVIEPLTAVFLERFNATAYIEDILRKVDEEAKGDKLEDLGLRQRKRRLKQRIENLRSRLGYEDKRKDDILLEEITNTENQLALVQQELAQKPKKAPPPIDTGKVREFLWRLWQNWNRFANRLKNELLLLFIERVELLHERKLFKATIVWKTGERQTIVIERPQARFAKEKLWRPDEDSLLRMLWPSASKEVVLAAFPNRSWKAIKERGFRLGLHRKRQPYRRGASKHWTDEEKWKLTQSYEAGTPVPEIAAELGRGQRAIVSKASELKLKRPRGVKWRRLEPIWMESAETLKGSKEECCRIG